ncbi:MAG: lysophospholipid acyltransferase family protein [Bacteroidales bacterium]|nr:lysophospholipid acyltransferase family protein [Bacteroidales bacterium]
MEKGSILKTIWEKFILLMSRLPLWFLYGISDVIYFLAYYIVRYRRSVVKKNLEIAFPDKTDKERKAIEKRYYHHLCDYFAETAKALTIPVDELISDKHMEIVNADLVNDLVAQGRQVFIYSGHVGNWEWFITFPKYFNESEIHTFYKTQKTSWTNDIIIASRTRGGIVAVDSKKGYRHIVECMRSQKKCVTLIIGDQSPKADAQQEWVDFMGINTAFLCGPVVIAQKTNQVLVYPSYIGYERGHYKVKLELVSENPKEDSQHGIISRFAQLLEADIRRCPEIWLWSHRRWKLNNVYDK